MLEGGASVILKKCYCLTELVSQKNDEFLRKNLGVQIFANSVNQVILVTYCFLYHSLKFVSRALGITGIEATNWELIPALV